MTEGTRPDLTPETVNPLRNCLSRAIRYAEGLPQEMTPERLATVRENVERALRMVVYLEELLGGEG